MLKHFSEEYMFRVYDRKLFTNKKYCIRRLCKF